MSFLDSRPLMSPQRPATPASQRELDRSLSPVGRQRTATTTTKRRRKATLLLASHLAAFVAGVVALALALALLPAPPPAPSSSPPSSSLLSRALDGLCELPRRRLLEARSGRGYLEAIDDAAAALPPSVHATLPLPTAAVFSPPSFSNRGSSSSSNSNSNSSNSSSDAAAAAAVEDQIQNKKKLPLLGQGRLVFVGDVHGCADELEELLFDKIKFDKNNGDTLVLLGDVVSKGPHSVRALRTARSLGAWSVRGNHDDAALAAYDFYRKSGGSLPRVSRAETGGEDYAFVKGLTRADAKFLREMPWTLEVPSYGAVAVHAGLVPGVAVNRQRLSDVFMMRGVVEVGGGGGGGDDDGKATEAKKKKKKKKTKTTTYRATATPGEGKPWARVWSSSEALNRRGKHVVFGHDSRSGLQREEFATGIDTGCVDGGSLTALVLPPVSSSSFSSSSSSSSSLSKESGSRWPEKGVELVSVKCRGVKK